jgi:hypothetical protein
MPAKSHRADLVILLALGALVVGTLLALASWGWIRDQENNLRGIRSTVSTGDEGTLAWYLLLERLGYQVRRAEDPLVGKTLAETDVLFVIDPTHRVEREETGAMEAWVRRGGILVCADEHRRFPWDLRRIGVKTPTRTKADDFFGDDDPAYSRFFEHHTTIPREDAHRPLARDVAKLLVSSDTAILFSEESEDENVDAVDVLLTDTDRNRKSVPSFRIATRRMGEGRVIFLADSSFVANSRIGKDDDAMLAVNLAAYAVSKAPGGRLAFDEYHFGLGRHETGWTVMAGMLFTTGAGWAVLVLTAAGLLYLVYRGRRFGTRRPGAPAKRRSKLEYVHAVGATYRAAGAHRLALALIYRWFRRRAALWAGIPASAPVADLADRLARRTGRPADRYVRILTACESAIAEPNQTSGHRLTSLLGQLGEIESEIFQ